MAQDQIMKKRLSRLLSHLPAKIQEPARFIIVGCIATAVHYGIYLILCFVIVPWLAYSIGFALSFALNFYLSNVFTFRTRPTVCGGLGFGLSHLINYLMHIALLQLFLSMGIAESIAPLAVFSIVIPVNFLLVRTALKR